MTCHTATCHTVTCVSQSLLIHTERLILCVHLCNNISCLKERDLPAAKKDLWNRMTGNIPEVYDPGNANGNVNVYPNSMYIDESGVEPSIRSKKLYIPLDAFFCQSSKSPVHL